jgi:beta-lactamase regulating signal transducer with metallopeptidase domain
MTTVIISLCLPYIQIPINLPGNSIISVADLVVNGNVIKIETEKSIQEQSFNWLYVFKAVYWAGFAFYLSQFVTALIKLGRIKKLGRPVMLEGVSCIISKNVQTPYSFFQHVYLPENRQLDNEELIRMIRHESVHMSQKHSVDNIFFELIRIVFWMNPFVHLFQKEIRQLHEFIADAAVIRHMDYETYCQFLIRFLDRSRQSTFASQLAQTPLKTRFTMMSRKPTPARAKWKYGGAFFLGIFSLLIFSCNDTNPSLSSAEVLNEPSLPLEITITEDLKYQIQTEIYSFNEIEKIIISYQSGTEDPRVNVRISNPATITVGDLDKLGDIAFKQHLNLVFYTE